MRAAAWLVCLPLLGCQSFGPAERVVLAQAPAAAGWFLPSSAFSSARDNRAYADSGLLDASRALEAGDNAAACKLLAEYAARHPESKNARAFYAEVLYKLGKADESAGEFESAIARLQEERTVDLGLIVHCHGRLLDLADANADEYSVHLHRGMGLYWLAQQKHAADDDSSREAILCKATYELMAAHDAAPGQARPMWYLHLVWKQLGQSAPAQRWMSRALAAEATSYLSPRERADLIMRSL